MSALFLVNQCDGQVGCHLKAMFCPAYGSKNKLRNFSSENILIQKPTTACSLRFPASPVALVNTQQQQLVQMFWLSGFRLVGTTEIFEERLDWKTI